MPLALRRPALKKPTPIREQVQDLLREEILANRLGPGERLVEARLAERLGASRTPIREALHRLEMEGLLVLTSPSGYQVKPISWAEVEEIVEIRVANETLAARWAMTRVTPAQLRALEENLRLAEAEIASGRPETFVKRGADFHDLLVQASGSTRLFELCHNLRRHMHRYRVESFQSADVARRALAGHRRILECLRSRDEAALAAVIRDHLERSKADIALVAFGGQGARS